MRRPRFFSLVACALAVCVGAVSAASRKHPRRPPAPAATPAEAKAIHAERSGLAPHRARHSVAATMAATSPGPRRVPAASSASTAALRLMVDRLLPEVAALSGRAATAPVATRVVDRVFIQQLVEQELTRAHAPDVLARRQRALIRLGALPPSTDLRRLLVELYTQQAAGLYDPRTDTLYLADWIPASLQTTTVAHELVHALQDRQLDLVSFLEGVIGNSDALAARQAVVEGEAVLVMQEHLVSHLMGVAESTQALTGFMTDLTELMGALKPSLAQLDAAPPFIRDGLLFPYLYGASFVEAARSRGSMPPSTLLADPPASTEQILHPERYVGTRDAPTAITAPRAAPMPGWVIVDTDVLGEAGLASLARMSLSDAEAAAAVAAGWDGDRYAYLESVGDASALVVWSVWDSAPDASEWQSAASAMFPHAVVECRGAHVVVLDGAPEGALDVWRAWAWRVWPSERSR